MNLAYIAHIRIPTEKAHGNQIMEMCAAFAKCTEHVELVVPKRQNAIITDPFVYHDVSRTFTLRSLWALDVVRFGTIGYLTSLMSFIASVIGYALLRRDTFFYTRDELVALCLLCIGKRVAWEGHTGQTNWAVRLLIRLRVPIVVITDALHTLYRSLGATPAQLLVASDGADLHRFAISVSQADARAQLGLPMGKKIVLYKGSLHPRKGAHTLARAAQRLTNEVVCVFIGGTSEEVAAFTAECGGNERVLILGNRPRPETPVYQKAADLLVIPNSAKDNVSKLYTSPMKLFGYMASGVPIIASDLPSLREIVDDTLVYFFTPDDAESLATVITTVLAHPEEAHEKAERTLALAAGYSWDARAKNILAFVKAV